MSASPSNRSMFVSTILILVPLIVLAVVFVRAQTELRNAALAASAPGDCRAVLDAQVQAWNRGDLDGFMEGYLASDTLRFFSDNTIASGFEPLRARYHQRYKAEGKEMGKLTFSEIEVLVPSAASAVVRGKWKVELSAETLEGLFTLVMERQPYGWRIVHDHTSAAPRKS